MTIKERTKEEARKTISKLLKPSGKILIVIKSVSASGMCRRMRVIAPDFIDITYWVASLCDLSINDDGLRITGCGMDMAFWLATQITHDMGWDKSKTMRGNSGDCIEWKAV